LPVVFWPASVTEGLCLISLLLAFALLGVIHWQVKSTSAPLSSTFGNIHRAMSRFCLYFFPREGLFFRFSIWLCSDFLRLYLYLFYILTNARHSIRLFGFFLKVELLYFRHVTFQRLIGRLRK
jgi:hypothetical protein